AGRLGQAHPDSFRQRRGKLHVQQRPPHPGRVGRRGQTRRGARDLAVRQAARTDVEGYQAGALLAAGAGQGGPAAKTPLEELFARFNPELPLERARTIPASWYTDPQLAEAERRRVFGRAWLAVGRADQVARPGFFTFDAGGVPILVVRSNEGDLRAFYN